VGEGRLGACCFNVVRSGVRGMSSVGTAAETSLC